MNNGDELIVAFELHDVDQIRAVLDADLDVRLPIRGKTPINWLTEMYTRSSAFPECVRTLLDRGAVLDDPAIAPVLLDDADAVKKNPALVKHRTTMVSAFTPLVGATMLHVAAEYGSAKAARALPQVHRREADIYAIITRLLTAAGRPVPPLENIPNRYLTPRGR
jgi:hypothetical protein